MDGRAALRVLLILVAVLSVSADGAVSPANVSALESPAPPAKNGPSSATFPVYGDVYPHGVYYAALSIGDPPSTYFLDVDTGSDLTWLQCDAPCKHCSRGPHPWYRPRKEKLVPCRDPLCSAVQAIAPPKPPPHKGCSQCDYEINYVDQGYSDGVLIADFFTLRLRNGSFVRPKLAFGCGYNQRFKEDPARTDGMLGLGSGKVGVLSQLTGQKVTNNVMGHCLGSRAGQGGVVGFVFFGDDMVPASRMTWAPMSRVGSENYYSLGTAGLYFGAKSLGVRMMNVVLDTGSSYSYLESKHYKVVLTAVRNDLSGKPLKEVKDPAHQLLCWRGQKPFKTADDVRSYFKNPLTLSFANGNGASLQLPPENYLIVNKDGDACLGILDGGSEIGLKNLNLIGDVSLQDLLVAYDNEKRRIGWIRTACTRNPSSEDPHP